MPVADSFRSCTTWEQLTGLPEDRWKPQHMEGLPRGTALDIEYYGGTSFNLRFRKPSTTEVVVDDLFFEYRIGGNSAEFFAAGTIRRGGAVAAAVNRNMLKVIDAHGIKTISVYAAETVGPYLWARAGFKPYADEWLDLRPCIAARLDKMRKNPGVGLHAETISPLFNALRSRDPRALWTIVDARERVGENALGAMLTLDLPWHGICDLSDPLCAARYRAFALRGPIPAWSPPTTVWQKIAHSLNAFARPSRWRKSVDPVQQVLATVWKHQHPHAQ